MVAVCVLLVVSMFLIATRWWPGPVPAPDRLTNEQRAAACEQAGGMWHGHGDCMTSMP